MTHRRLQKFQNIPTVLSAHHNLHLPRDDTRLQPVRPKTPKKSATTLLRASRILNNWRRGSSSRPWPDYSPQLTARPLRRCFPRAGWGSIQLTSLLPPCLVNGKLYKRFSISVTWRPPQVPKQLTTPPLAWIPCPPHQPKRSTGLEGVQMFIIKESINYIKRPLTNILNASLNCGIFPDDIINDAEFEIFPDVVACDRQTTKDTTQI